MNRKLNRLIETISMWSLQRSHMITLRLKYQISKSTWIRINSMKNGIKTRRNIPCICRSSPNACLEMGIIIIILQRSLWDNKLLDSERWKNSREGENNGWFLSSPLSISVCIIPLISSFWQLFVAWIFASNIEKKKRVKYFL